MWVGHSCPTKPRRKAGLFFFLLGLVATQSDLCQGTDVTCST